ncbi:MAG: tandem-95 repeat protein [Planctomycetales bacterium]|nr:tandem-95 repeat protein [Planctomycetales bacterium]
MNRDRTQRRKKNRQLQLERLDGRLMMTGGLANGPSLALPLAIGSTVPASVDAPRDEDWFVVRPTAGATYVFETFEGTLDDTTLSLYANDGATRLAYDDDGGVGMMSRIQWQAPNDQPIYVMARAWSAYRTGVFQLSVSGFAATDDHGNSAADATLLTPGTVAAAEIETQGDTDWFRIPVTPGTSYRFETRRGTLTDTTLTLFDAEGKRLAYDDDSGEGSMARIQWTAAWQTEVFLQAQGWSSRYTGSFIVAAETLPGDQNNSAASADRLEVGQVVGVEIETAGDVDWFRVDVVAGRQYTFETSASQTAPGVTDTTLRLLAADGSTSLAYDDDGGVGLYSRLQWTATEDGPVYLQARAYSNAARGSFLLAATAESRAPHARGDEYTVNEDEALVVPPTRGLLFNDEPGGGGTLLVGSVVTLPHSGQVEVNPDGSFRYVPNADFYGIDRFSYRPQRDSEVGNVAEVVIDVQAVNDAPTSRVDQYLLQEDAVLTVPRAEGVLHNDSDIDSPELSAVLIEGPSHGQLAWNPDGSFQYIPDANFFGVDQFIYRPHDGQADGEATAVDLTVAAVNDPPLARGNQYLVEEDLRLAIDESVLDNDEDADGDPLAARVVVQPEHGQLQFSTDGRFVYLPDAEYSGRDEFTYRVEDAAGASMEAVVEILVAAVNDAPAPNVDSYYLAVGTLQIDAEQGLLTNDRDVDDSELRVSLVEGPRHGKLELRADGSFDYTPDLDFQGTDRFVYRVEDPHGAVGESVTLLGVGLLDAAAEELVDSLRTHYTSAATAATAMLRDLGSTLLNAPLDAARALRDQAFENVVAPFRLTAEALEGAWNELKARGLTPDELSNTLVQRVRAASGVSAQLYIDRPSIAFSNATSAAMHGFRNSAESTIEYVLASMSLWKESLGSFDGLELNLRRAEELTVNRLSSLGSISSTQYLNLFRDGTTGTMLHGRWERVLDLARGSVDDLATLAKELGGKASAAHGRILSDAQDAIENIERELQEAIDRLLDQIPKPPLPPSPFFAQPSMAQPVQLQGASNFASIPSAIQDQIDRLRQRAARDKTTILNVRDQDLSNWALDAASDVFGKTISAIETNLANVQEHAMNLIDGSAIQAAIRSATETFTSQLQEAVENNPWRQGWNQLESVRSQVLDSNLVSHLQTIRGFLQTMATHPPDSLPDLVLDAFDEAQRVANGWWSDFGLDLQLGNVLNVDVPPQPQDLGNLLSTMRTLLTYYLPTPDRIRAASSATQQDGGSLGGLFGGGGGLLHVPRPALVLPGLEQLAEALTPTGANRQLDLLTTSELLQPLEELVTQGPGAKLTELLVELNALPEFVDLLSRVFPEGSPLHAFGEGLKDLGAQLHRTADDWIAAAQQLQQQQLASVEQLMDAAVTAHHDAALSAAPAALVNRAFARFRESYEGATASLPPAEQRQLNTSMTQLLAAVESTPEDQPLYSAPDRQRLSLTGAVSGAVSLASPLEEGLDSASRMLRTSVTAVGNALVGFVEGMSDAATDFAGRLADLGNPSTLDYYVRFLSAFAMLVRDTHGAPTAAALGLMLDGMARYRGEVFGRSLTDEEESLAELVFGTQLDLSQVRVIDQENFFANFGAERAHVHGNTVFLDPRPWGSETANRRTTDLLDATSSLYERVVDPRPTPRHVTVSASLKVVDDDGTTSLTYDLEHTDILLGSDMLTGIVSAAGADQFYLQLTLNKGEPALGVTAIGTMTVAPSLESVNLDEGRITLSWPSDPGVHSIEFRFANQEEVGTYEIRQGALGPQIIATFVHELVHVYQNQHLRATSSRAVDEMISQWQAPPAMPKASGVQPPEHNYLASALEKTEDDRYRVQVDAQTTWDGLGERVEPQAVVTEQFFLYLELLRTLKDAETRATLNSTSLRQEILNTDPNDVPYELWSMLYTESGLDVLVHGVETQRITADSTYHFGGDTSATHQLFRGGIYTDAAPLLLRVFLSGDPARPVAEVEYRDADDYELRKIGAGSQQVTAVSVDKTTGKVELTWNSNPGAHFLRASYTYVPVSGSQAFSGHTSGNGDGSDDGGAAVITYRMPHGEIDRKPATLVILDSSATKTIATVEFAADGTPSFSYPTETPVRTIDRAELDFVTGRMTLTWDADPGLHFVRYSYSYRLEDSPLFDSHQSYIGFPRTYDDAQTMYAGWSNYIRLFKRPLGLFVTPESWRQLRRSEGGGGASLVAIDAAMADWN